MKINKIIRQHRRDMYCEYICEHCGDIKEGSGYDDHHFHTSVVPSMVCVKCGECSPTDYRPLTTKYPEGEQH